MNKTTKEMSKQDADQTLKYAFSDETATLSTGGFIDSKVGHKVEAIPFDAVSTDYNFYNGTTLLKTIRITYTDSTQDTFLSAERIA